MSDAGFPREGRRSPPPLPVAFLREGRAFCERPVPAGRIAGVTTAVCPDPVRSSGFRRYAPCRNLFPPSTSLSWIRIATDSPAAAADRNSLRCRQRACRCCRRCCSGCPDRSCWRWFSNCSAFRFSAHGSRRRCCHSYS